MRILMVFLASTIYLHAQDWTPVPFDFGAFHKLQYGQNEFEDILNDFRLGTSTKEKVIVGKLRPLLKEFNYPDLYLKELAHILVQDFRSTRATNQGIYLTVLEYVMESYLRKGISLRLNYRFTDFQWPNHIKKFDSLTDARAASTGGKWFYFENYENPQYVNMWIENGYDLKQFMDLVNLYVNRKSYRKTEFYLKNKVDLFRYSNNNYHLIKSPAEVGGALGECLIMLRIRPTL